MQKKVATREGVVTSIRPYLNGHVVRIKMDTYLYFSEKFSKTLWINVGAKEGTLYNFLREGVYDLLGQTIRASGEYHVYYGSEYKRLLYVDKVISLYQTRSLFTTEPHTKDRLFEVVRRLNPRVKVTKSMVRKILQSPFLPIKCHILKDFHMCYTIYKLLEMDALVRVSDNMISLEVLGNYFVHLFQESMANNKEGLVYTDGVGYGINFSYAFQRAVRDLPFIFYEEVLDSKVREILEYARSKEFTVDRNEEVLRKLYHYLTPWFLVKKELLPDGKHEYVLYPHYYRKVRGCALRRVEQTLSFLNEHKHLQSIRWEDSMDREKLAKGVAHFLIESRPPIFIITGDAGTGKSTFIVKLVHYLSNAGVNVSVTGITGKSVRRLNELFVNQGGKPIAKTLARELGQKYNGTYNVDTISSEVLVIDEASMIDLHRLSRINKVFSNDGQVLILAGDPKQLEPIGGENIFLNVVNLLRDTPFLLELRRNYRFTLDREVYVIAVERLEKIPSLVVALLSKNRILKDTGKWKVATYTHRQNYIGTQYLNSYIRRHITSSSEPFFYGEPALVVDNETDPLTKHLKLANKEEVKVISVKGDEAYVMSSTGIAKIPTSKLNYSYVVEYRTVQGEEYDIFVFIAVKSKINRNVFYTMLTRGKRKVYMITTKNSLNDILLHFGKDLKSFRAQVYKEGNSKKKWIKVDNYVLKQL